MENAIGDFQFTIQQGNVTSIRTYKAVRESDAKKTAELWLERGEKIIGCKRVDKTVDEIFKDMNALMDQ